jgi:ribosomal protein S18 acetylase RimI-like enzyme
MVAAARAIRPASLPDGLGLRLSDDPDDGWLSLYRYRGQELPPVARRLLVSAPRQVFASVLDGERTVAVGRLSVSRGWGGVTAMEVAPSHRRRGLGSAVLGALAARSVRLGGTSLFLQVAEENAGARALYGAAGFTEHHRYAYWSPPA